MTRDENGDIIVKDKAEYYIGHSVEVVEDAFAIDSFSKEISTGYVEGRTDKAY